ncbi:MAG: T9SS type A sorting domain-containing protein [Bacteroidia bacterium]|nr:T9SS type A sorting domain-containing protein [Bacteroidia bacterium]
MKTSRTFLFLLLIFLSLASNSTFSQGWQHKFGGSTYEDGFEAKQTNDGGYILVGNTKSYGGPGANIYVVKTDSKGKLQWQQIISTNAEEGSYAVGQNASGEYYIAGQTNGQGAGKLDVYVIKLTTTGSVLWTNTYGGAEDENAYGLVVTASDEVVIAGTTKSFGAGGTDAYYLKINSAGTVVWTKVIGKTGNELIYDINAVHDGGFLMTGSTKSYGTNYGYAIRTNSNGDTLWTKSYNIGSLTGSVLNSGTELISNSQFVFVGSGGSSLYGNMVILITDLIGNATSTTYSSALAEGALSVTKTSDGGFAVAGVNCNFGCRTVLNKYNSSGIKLWEKRYVEGAGNSNADFSKCYSVRETADGGFILGGLTYMPGYESDFLLIKTDSNGETPQDYVGSIVVNGPVEFCTGGSVQLTAPSGYEHYQWIKFDNNVRTTLPNTDSLSITVSTNGKYQCVMTDEDGIYFTDPLIIKVNSAPTATITSSSSTSFCGTFPNMTLTATSSTNSSYIWKLNNVAINGATTSSYVPMASGSYTVTMTNMCGSTTSSATVISNNAPPPANICCLGGYVDIKPNGSICNPFDLSVTAQPGSTYQWFYNGAPTVYQPGNNHFYPSQTGFYYAVVTNSCGSSTSASCNVTAYVQGQASINVYQPVTGCASFPITLESPYSPSNSYQWYLNGNAISGATGATYNATSNGVYNCVYIDNCVNYDYASTSDLTINITGSAAPTHTISTSSPSVVCSGNSILTSSLTGVTYEWYKNNTIIPGATLQSYVATTTGYYYCKAINATCGGIQSNTVSLKFGTPVAQINGGNNVCQGNYLTLSLSTSEPTSTFTSIQWRRNGANIPGANGLTYNATIDGTYDCMITNDCGTVSTTNSKVLTLTNMNTVISPAGTVPICPGTNVILTVPPTPGATYQWYHSGSPLSGMTQNSAAVNVNGNYNVLVRLGTCSVYSAAVNLVYHNFTSANIWTSTVPEFCNTGSVQLNANTRNDYTYTWKRNNTAIGGANAASYNATLGGDYSVTIVDSAGCSSTSPLVKVISSGIGNISINAAGPVTFCQGGSVILTPSTTGNSYFWSRNGILIPGATNSQYSADSTGLYSVQVTNSQGCSGTATLFVEELTNAAPTATITPAGNTTFCSGSNVTLNANTGTGLTYQWKKYGNPIAGATASSYVATGSGSYRVVVTNASGCSASASPVTVTVNPLPSASITATGSTAICPGSSVTLNANTGAGLNYQWRKYSNDISGATGATYNATGAGTYKVRVTNTNGCSKNSNSIVVTSLTAPVATITATGATTFCAGDSVKLSAATGAGNTYQWRKGSSILNGATGLNYYAKTTGNYKVTVTATNGCTKNSNVIAVNVPCRVGEFAEIPFDIYPNPSSGIFKVVNGENEYATLEIKDVTGKLIFTALLVDQETEIDLTQFPAGIYIAFLKTNNSTQMKKLIIR